MASYKCDMCKRQIISDIVITCTCNTKYCRQCLEKLMKKYEAREGK